jgi:hypothetical protein
MQVQRPNACAGAAAHSEIRANLLIGKKLALDDVSEPPLNTNANLMA